MNAIEIRNLSKSFRGTYALNGLNMAVLQGSFYGFIVEIITLGFAIGMGAISSAVLNKTSLV